ncbi:uncharacterized protein LOC117235201 [Bombus vosnesenskii]|uniref:Uncharacterized protein LOC117235201 n=2 Tax=Pyrobombus TaxID=144703 RepID=A0A6J3KIY5_9HYME|nr:uncharacterized protein LOC117153674 [Bombus vancouverensis nearcticus]XP_033302506.1 uncharacterized protein LOC117206913 [Bombus bifarius]XP_033352910.1 uncharacterized protein LOC117235201 [Bombus vosnesenskii]XP_050479727.1 uncharacterized protein LOC126868407 [Bombus huntii]
MKTSKSPKVIREAQADDLDEYEGVATTATLKEKDSNTEPQLSEQMIQKISGRTTIKLSLHSAGIVLASIIVVSCLCTLLIRNRLMKLFDRIRGKKKKGKFIAIGDDIEDVSRSYFIRKPRIKRKRPPSYELVHTATQNSAPPPSVPQEPEEPEPMACYRCYKKKRKKSTKRPKR